MEEFKVGDWLVLEKTLSSYWTKGKLWQIGNITNNTFYESEVSKITGRPGTLRESIEFCRKALPHEIPNNELIIEIW